MSILIKGMDMPKASNEDCIAVIRSNGKVEVWQTGTREFEAKAIQIPTPHGRLIDADKLRENIEEVDRPDGYTALVHIKYAPTILESEE